MCEKCTELDSQIARYRRIKANISDRQIEAATAQMMAELELQKVALHPPEK